MSKFDEKFPGVTPPPGQKTDINRFWSVARRWQADDKPGGGRRRLARPLGRTSDHAAAGAGEPVGVAPGGEPEAPPASTFFQEAADKMQAVRCDIMAIVEDLGRTLEKTTRTAQMTPESARYVQALVQAIRDQVKSVLDKVQPSGGEKTPNA